eukprot:970316-Amphidinium_carterae.2
MTAEQPHQAGDIEEEEANDVEELEEEKQEQQQLQSLFLENANRLSGLLALKLVYGRLPSVTLTRQRPARVQQKTVPKPEILV